MNTAGTVCTSRATPSSRRCAHEPRRIRRPAGPAPPHRRRVWETLTWADYGGGAEVTAGLAELGSGAGEQVGIFSNNRVEWHLADFGALANGSVTVPLYQTSSPEQVAYVLGHAEARVCFVENQELLARVLEVGDELPSSTGSSCSRTATASTTRSSSASPSSARSARPACSATPASSTTRADAVEPEQLATLVYTSGTTGPPKGTMISHANIMWTIRSAVEYVHIQEANACSRSCRCRTSPSA